MSRTKRVPKSSNKSKRQPMLGRPQNLIKQSLVEVKSFLNSGDFEINDKIYVFRLGRDQIIKIKKIPKIFDEKNIQKLFTIDLLAQQVNHKLKGQDFIKELEALGTHEKYIYFDDAKTNGSFEMYQILSQLTYVDDEIKTIKSKELDTVLQTLASIYKDKDHAKKFLRIAEIIQKDLASIGIASSRKGKLKFFVEGEEIIISDSKALCLLRLLYDKRCFYPEKGLKYNELIDEIETEAADLYNYLKKGKGEKKEKELRESKIALSKIICKGFNNDKLYISRGVVISIVP